MSRRITSSRPGKNLCEQLAGRHRLVVVEVHAAGGVEEGGGGGGVDFEVVREEADEVVAVERGGEREHRVIEPDVFELHDRVGDFLRPVAAAAFDHAVGEAVERDIEDVAAGPLEPGGHAAELVVLFEQQHAAAGAGQHVGGGQAGQAAADDDDVVFVFGVFEEIAGHGWGMRGGCWMLDAANAAILVNRVFYWRSSQMIKPCGWFVGVWVDNRIGRVVHAISAQEKILLIIVEPDGGRLPHTGLVTPGLSQTRR